MLNQQSGHLAYKNAPAERARLAITQHKTQFLSGSFAANLTAENRAAPKPRDFDWRRRVNNGPKIAVEMIEPAPAAKKKPTIDAFLARDGSPSPRQLPTRVDTAMNNALETDPPVETYVDVTVQIPQTPAHQPQPASQLVTSQHIRWVAGVPP